MKTMSKTLQPSYSPARTLGRLPSVKAKRDALRGIHGAQKGARAAEKALADAPGRPEVVEARQMLKEAQERLRWASDALEASLK